MSSLVNNSVFTFFIKVLYDSGVSVKQGKELTPTQVQNEPVKIEWPVENGTFYTLCMTGLLF